MTKIEHPNFGRGEFPHVDAQAQPFQNANAGVLPKFTNHPTQSNAVLIKAKRGRPAGSKNKPKAMTLPWEH